MATSGRDKNYKFSELNPAIRRHIRLTERQLGRKCRKIWSFTNPKGDQFLFGSFCKNYDRLFVTIGHYNRAILGFLPSGWEGGHS